MKIPQSVARILLVLEAAALVAVLALGIIRPITAPDKNQTGNNNISSESDNTNQEEIESSTQETENGGSEEVKPESSETPLKPVQPEFSPEVLAKVEEMTLEQKIAQMFILTPEALAGVDKVTVMGNATKKALEKYPIGGLVYSSKNFQNKSQTSNMLKALQEYYSEEFGIPMFLMVEELGGDEYSPLATANGYTVQASPFEIGVTGEVQKTIDAVKEIAKYLKEAGFNMNLAPNADLANGQDSVSDGKTYAADSSVAAMMVAEAVSTYGQKGIMTVMSMFPGESNGLFMNTDKTKWEESAGLAYKAGIGAGADAIMIGNVYASDFTGNTTSLCSMSEDMVSYIREDLQYQGILMTDSFSENIITSNYTAKEAAVAAVRAGVDMIFCSDNFEEAYHALVEAVNNGEIKEEAINTSVARILTCKAKLAQE